MKSDIRPIHTKDINQIDAFKKFTRMSAAGTLFSSVLLAAVGIVDSTRGSVAGTLFSCVLLRAVVSIVNSIRRACSTPSIER